MVIGTGFVDGDMATWATDVAPERAVGVSPAVAARRCTAASGESGGA